MHIYGHYMSVICASSMAICSVISILIVLAVQIVKSKFTPAFSSEDTQYSRGVWFQVQQYPYSPWICMSQREKWVKFMLNTWEKPRVILGCNKKD